MKKWISAAFLLGTACLLGSGMAGCGSPKDDPTRLEFVSTGKATMAVGDTSDLWVVSKTYVEATGRTITTKPYTYFTLASSDPTVAYVIRNQQLVALKPGKVQVTASDDKSALVTASAATITVVGPP